jgi:hypothetical protein
MRGGVAGLLVLAALATVAPPPAHAALERGWGDLVKRDRRAAGHVRTQRLQDCPRKDPRPDFETYWVGSPFEGLESSGLLRTCTKVDPLLVDIQPELAKHRENHLSVTYGTCEPPCQFPLSVQTWPACERNLFDNEAGGPRPHRKYLVDGIPVAGFVRGFEGVEVYTGGSTVVIFAPLPQALRAVAALRATDGDPATASKLPLPRTGVLSGRIRCHYERRPRGA